MEMSCKRFWPESTPPVFRPPMKLSASLVLIRACRLWALFSIAQAVSAQPAVPFSEVYPVLQKHCVKCHGPEKVKGKLRLDTPEGLKAGGVSGAVLVAGVPEKSLLFQRIVLPADDEEVMPPSGKKLSESEQHMVRNWIATGGSMEGWNPGQARELSRIDPAIQNALLKLRAAGAYAGPQHQGASTYSVDFRLRRLPLTPEVWAALEPLAEGLEELDLSGQTLPSDASLLLRTMPQLRRLSLRESSLAAELFKSRPSLPALEFLNLFGCPNVPGEAEETVAAKVAQWIRTLPALRVLHAGGGFLSRETLEGLQAAFPQIRILGDPVLDAPPEVTEPQKEHPLAKG